MAFGVYTGFRVPSQCLQYFPCPQSPEVLKALEANIIPTYSWVAVGETMIAQIGWQSRHRVTCYLSMLSTLPVPSKTFSVESRAQDVLKAVQVSITPIHIRQLQLQRVFTGFMVTLQCFQHFPCPPKLEGLNALQDNMTPAYSAAVDVYGFRPAWCITSNSLVSFLFWAIASRMTELVLSSLKTRAPSSIDPWDQLLMPWME
ncbi:hypothetical protein BDL97_16G039000 [Sphagnum fallax]|nr:hypothetical protein BDL97_16G039000 [Sphagnum fallax]